MNPKIISEESAEKEMQNIGVDKAGIKIMLPKTKFRILKLHNIRNAMCNILKQEMLSIGGDIAVNKGCVNCTVQNSDILIIGTIKQFKKLIRKMYSQPAEAKKIAKEIETIINLN